MPQDQSRKRCDYRAAVCELEGRVLLAGDIEPNGSAATAVVTSLTGHSPGTDSASGSIAPRSGDSFDIYRFTVGEGASIKVTLQTPDVPGAAYTLALHEIGAPSIPSLSAINGTGNLALPEISGHRDRFYYVTISQLFDFGSNTTLPYTLAITTGSGKPQADINLSSASLTNSNKTATYAYSTSDDPGEFSVSAFLSADDKFDSTDNHIRTNTVRPEDGASGTGSIDLGIGVVPSTRFPYLLVVADPGRAIFESDENNNVISINIDELVSTPQIQILNLPADNTFRITADGNMPLIHARVVGVNPGPNEDIEYAWQTRVIYRAQDYPALRGQFGPGRDIASPDYNEEVIVNSQDFVPTFMVGDKLTLRGGTVVLTVRVTIGGTPLELSTPSQGNERLQILGQNPDRRTVSAFVSKELTVPQQWPSNTQYNYHSIIRKIINHESQVRQFHESGVPLWSMDGARGVGMMQITAPQPSDDEVWDWRENIRGGARVFSQKLGTAIRRLNLLYRQILTEAAQVVALVPPITGDMVVLNAIRGYNGYSNGFGILDEWRPVRDSHGRLVIDGNGQTSWERTPALERVRPELRNLPHQEILSRSPGNYRYVDDILNTADF
jgi:hypothetical protein